MLKFHCGRPDDSVEQVGSATEEELLRRFPDAAIIGIFDPDGNLNFLRLSRTEAKYVEFPIKVAEISEPLDTVIKAKVIGPMNPPPTYIGPSGGSGVLYHVPHG